MKKIISTIALSLLPSVVFAEGNYAFITAVHPVYKDNYITHYKTNCYDVKVPIYVPKRGSDSDVLTGAIIGGVIGNQIGSGSNKDAMTVLGVIIGADQGSRRTRHVVQGYTMEQRCDREAYQVNEPYVSHYNIRYEYNGVEYTDTTNRHYTLGQRVNIRTSLE